ncbi:MAG: NADH-quinone oxidoreductase subunit A [Thermoguttaceae bacterium]|jgi:NADH-quinone oxidoreductase subunit A
MSPTSIVAYLTLFAAVAFLFVLASLSIGRLLRADLPSAQKLEPYECGEPPVGSAFVQFDLRFYVVALVFIIFEVEVALFFPVATVFGKATQLMDPGAGVAPAGGLFREADGTRRVPATTEADGTRSVPATIADSPPVAPGDARLLAIACMLDLGVFFAVILVAFAYVWWRGDLDWVRAYGRSGDAAQTVALRISP